MKVAISALGSGLDDRVDARFGRAAHLLVVDTETMETVAIDNTANRQALQGAGIGAAEAVVGAGSQAVLTGHLGPKAYTALTAAGLTGYKADGMTVREAITAFGTGSLEPLDEGESHSGMQ